MNRRSEPNDAHWKGQIVDNLRHKLAGVSGGGSTNTTLQYTRVLLCVSYVPYPGVVSGFPEERNANFE